MFTLSYSPAYDPYHAIFRIVSILVGSKTRSIELRKLRFIDFYTCFPWLLRDVAATRAIPGFIRKRNAIVEGYKATKFDVLPSSRVLFARMEPVQVAAIGGLMAKKVISEEVNGNLRLYEDQLNPQLLARVLEFNAQNQLLIDFLSNDLSQVVFHGQGGLKDRSGLDEFRYDDVPAKSTR